MATEKSGKALKIDVKTPAGKTEGSVDLPAELFDAPENIGLMHQVATAQRAAARQGTHSTKTRGEVRGGGRKPYRQKGTGRARQGSTRAPQFTGGCAVRCRTGHAMVASMRSPSWCRARLRRPRAPRFFWAR